MIIDNGQQVRLVIDGVFEGMAGQSRGRVAFVPNRDGRNPEDVRGGLLNGEPVRLAIREEGGLYSAGVEALV